MPVVVLASKLVLVPLLIAGITIAGTRFGPRIAGVLTGLPVVAGPVMLFIALEQGAAFAARAARATLASEASLAAFCVLYAAACLRMPWLPSLAFAWAGFALGTLVLDRLDPSLGAAFALALATPLVVLAASPRPALSAERPTVARPEIALRMAAGDALVLTLTALAPALGPRRSGLLTVFPVAATVLSVFSHRSHGGPFAVHLLRGLAVGLYSLTAFFATLVFALEPLGIAPAFVLALLASLAAQAAVLGAASVVLAPRLALDARDGDRDPGRRLRRPDAP